MKHVPISIKVPGSDFDVLDLSPYEAKLLIQRTQRQLEVWNNMLTKHGRKKASSEMSKYNDRYHR